MGRCGPSVIKTVSDIASQKSVSVQSETDFFWKVINKIPLRNSGTTTVSKGVIRFVFLKLGFST